MRFLALLLVFLASAMAFPRLGLHEGYTRLVFDLEAKTQYQVSQTSDTLAIRFSGQKVGAEDTSVTSGQIASYQIVPNPDGATAFIRLKGLVEVKTTLFDDTNGRRLVVDILSASSSKPTVSTKPDPPAQTTLIRPAAYSAPKIVVIDAGHGGKDSGTVGYVTEKKTTLDLALRVRDLLEAQGIKVVLTRDDDTFIPLTSRAAMANFQRNLFLSIHVNSAPSIAQGIEVYYFGQLTDNSLLSQVIRENGGGTEGKRLTQESQSVAERFLSDVIAQTNLRFSRQLASKVQSNLLQSTGALNRGIRQAPFVVIREARIPAVLVEVGFANHPTEGPKLATDAYRQTLAGGIVKGIVKFLDNASNG